MDSYLLYIDGNYESLSADELPNYPLSLHEFNVLFRYSELTDKDGSSSFDKVRMRLNSRPPEEVAKLLIDGGKFNISPIENIIKTTYLKENVEFIMSFLRLNPRQIYENWTITRWNDTPLIQAVRESNFEVFRQFRELGFDMTVVDKHGTSVESLLKSQRETLEKNYLFKTQQLDSFENLL